MFQLFAGINSTVYVSTTALPGAVGGGSMIPRQTDIIIGVCVGGGILLCVVALLVGLLACRLKRRHASEMGADLNSGGGAGGMGASRRVSWLSHNDAYAGWPVGGHRTAPPVSIGGFIILP